MTPLMEWPAGMTPGPDVTEMWRWSSRAACREAIADGWALEEWWFPTAADGRAGDAAKEICAGCLVRAECLHWALKHLEHGVWGGLSDRERQRIRVRPRDCAECGREFSYTVRGGGRAPSTCSEACHVARRERQVRESYERSDRARDPGRLLAAGHGRISRYVGGCRCAACRRAARLARKAQRARAAVLSTTTPADARNAAQNVQEGVA